MPLIMELFVCSALLLEAGGSRVTYVSSLFVGHARPGRDFGEQAAATDTCVIRAVECAYADARRERGNLGRETTASAGPSGCEFRSS